MSTCACMCRRVAYVCIRVCVYLCMCVCAYVCTRAFACMYVYACMCTCVCVYVCACVHVCAFRRGYHWRSTYNQKEIVKINLNVSIIIMRYSMRTGFLLHWIIKITHLKTSHDAK